ncbi:protein-disulfide reductase DsbD family protein [Bosea sp. (in: a-proteobacteria)]|uniref:protein-disulfide reductase DsbD family protein n=1 Tax=Bosea sp. (in: a-proteobacteria) TaxID=1871050 RepID=UPI002FC62E2D
MSTLKMTAHTGLTLARRAALALALLIPAAALAAESTAVTSPRVVATLLSSRDAVAPGERFQLALVQKIAPGWHTYWQNPGDSGEPTKIDWTLPDGAKAGPIQWPAPSALPVEPLLNFGFEGTVVLPVEISVPAQAKPGERFTITANATWLVCEKICIPEEGVLKLDLPVEAAGIVDAAAQGRIDQALADLPKPAGFKAKLTANGADKLALALPGLPAGASELRYFPLSDTLIEHAAAQPSEGGSLTLTRSSAFRIAEPTVEGVVTFREGGARRALLLSAEVEPGLIQQASAPARPPAAVTLPALPALPAEDLTIWLALAFAFAGGLILNLMPCVLPVLFIKALGFAQAARASRSQVRQQGLLFLSGVVATFMVLAGLAIALGAGWGFQLQSPPLVILLAVLMSLIGFNLIGAFEIGGRVQGLGDGLASRSGPLGAFMTGALAVVVATPCTAPFMGAAMGYALTQPPAAALSIFLALALGFAAPVVALSFAPGLQRLLPKPGPWMVVLKQAFAFPMFATAIWLIWVATMQAGANGALAALVAILVASFSLWLIGVTRRSGLVLRAIAAAAALLLVGATSAFVIESAAPTPPSQARAEASDAWSPARVAELQAQGKPVFVNFTAAWCITCLANERVALSRQEVKDAFAKLGVATLKADWTNRNAVIAATLAEHGRAGVPLYLFYPASKGAQAEILPQLLTPDILIGAAERAAGREVKTAASEE